ncbi:hypothetical protein LTR93_010833 [Exophiala xenobiotica]|nr:hypothetical protein LTR93_010833 [Exophiala xenobiotica]
MHRDIKPANILLTHESPSAEWKLSDFGLAKLADITGTFCGSPLYLAPEVDALVGSVYTNAVDVWFVGVVGMRYSCGFDARVLKKTRARKDHIAWGEALARRAQSKASPLREYLTVMLGVMPTGRPIARDLLARLQDWRDSQESGPGKGVYDDSEENEAESLQDDREDRSDAVTIRAAGEGDGEENEENVSSEVTF